MTITEKIFGSSVSAFAMRAKDYLTAEPLPVTSIDLGGGKRALDVNARAGFGYQKQKLQFTGIGAYSQYDGLGALVEIANFAAYAGGAGRVTECRIVCSKKTCLPQFEVHFFKSTPATYPADNAAWDERLADEDIRAGFFQMPVLAVASGSASIDFSRSQHDDYGVALSKDIKCATGSTAIKVGLKLINAPATAFDSSPGNTISVHLGWMQG